MEVRLTTRVEYDAAKMRVEKLIAEATEKGMLEPDMDNEYTQEIASLSREMATYEDEFLNVMPLREKSPLIRSIEEYFFSHNLKQKECAALLGVNEAAFSQIMSGKRRISMPFAKRLHSRLGINSDLILEYA